MRFLLSFLLFFQISVLCIAQKENSFFRQSLSMPRTEANRTYALLYDDSTSYKVLRFDKYKTYGEIHHYDTLLQHLATYQATDQARKYVGIIGIKEKMYLLYFSYIKNKTTDTYEKVSLYAKTILPETFQLRKDSTALIEPFKMESNYYRGNFAISPDKSKILVYDYEEDGDIDGISGLTNNITLRVFDTDLNLLWTRKVDLSPADQPQRVVVIKKLRINNQGEIAILTDIFRKERSYEQKYVTADPTLFFVGQQPENFARFTPNLGEFFFNQIDFTFDQEGNVIWFGFYSKQRYYQQSGFFYLKINASKTKVLVKKHHEFSEEFIREVLGKKNTKQFTELSGYKLVNWRRTSDGGMVLTAEHQPYSVASFRSNGMVAIRLDAQGEIVWKHFFYKVAAQGKQMETFLSHYLMVDGDYAYILYNEGIYSDGYARAIRIDMAGQLRRRTVVSYDSQADLICPELSYPLSGGRLFICMQDRFFQGHRVGVLNMNKLFE